MDARRSQGSSPFPSAVPRFRLRFRLLAAAPLLLAFQHPSCWLQLLEWPRPTLLPNSPRLGFPTQPSTAKLQTHEDSWTSGVKAEGPCYSGSSSKSPLSLTAGLTGNFLRIVAAGVAVVALCAPAWASAAAADASLAKVAPCLVSKCQLPLAKCVLSPSCAANLTCIIGCSGQPDEKTCQIKCGDNFENDVVDEFNACALSNKKCVPQRPDVGPLPGEAKWTPVNGRYPVPPQEAVSQDFNVGKMTGAWYITAGLNPLFDTFPCQAHFFEGMAPAGDEPGRLLGKINWRISEPDGEFLTKSTVQSFVETNPGVLENHNNEYLHYQDDWFVLDHGFEDDPDLGFVLIYYRGRNDAWAGYGGGTLYTRQRSIPPQVIDRVVEACGRANVPFYKYWTITDNTCPDPGDPAKLRAAFAERLAEQAAQSAEVQFTYLARSAYSEVDKEERYVIKATKRLERMTRKFLEQEGQAFKQASQKLEAEIEKDEIALEQPAIRLLNYLFKH